MAVWWGRVHMVGEEEEGEEGKRNLGIGRRDGDKSLVGLWGLWRW